MNEEARRKVSKARSQLILRKPFWGFLALHLEVVEDNCMPIPTMGADGVVLRYDPDFVLKVEDASLMCVIAHECFHCAFGHIWRHGNREPMRWNVATDFAANCVLKKEGFNTEGMLYDKQFEGKSAEEIYDMLPEIKVSVVSVGASGGEGDGSGSGSGPANESNKQRGQFAGKAKIHDGHSDWDKSNEGGKEGMGNELKNALGIKNGKDGKSLERQWQERASRARQVAKSQGVGMGNVDELIDELLEPQISWKEILRNTVSSCICTNYRLMPPNKKHLWRGIYLPSLYGEKIEAAIAIDTSGSMSASEIAMGIAEIRSVCEQFQDYTIHFYQCDDGVQQYIKIDPYTEVPNKIKGRGGTSFVPVFKDIKKKGLDISLLAYFTDLMGTFPDEQPDYPVIWVATAGRKEVPFGELIDYGKHK